MNQLLNITSPTTSQMKICGSYHLGKISSDWGHLEFRFDTQLNGDLILSFNFYDNLKTESGYLKDYQGIPIGNMGYQNVNLTQSETINSKFYTPHMDLIPTPKWINDLMTHFQNAILPYWDIDILLTKIK